MPAVGFRFRAHTDQRTLGALKAQLRLACEIYNSLRRADTDLHRRNGRCPTLTELRGLALDLRKRSEYYRQLHPRWRRGSPTGSTAPGGGSSRAPRGSATSADSWGRIWRWGDGVFERPTRGWGADRDCCAPLNALRRAGWEPPAAPAEPRPLPAAEGRGQGGAV